MSNDESSADDYSDDDYSVDQLALLSIAKVEARVIGLTAARSHKIHISDCVEGEIPAVFGDKWHRRFSGVRDYLQEKYGDKLQELLQLAIREYVFMCHNGAAYFLVQLTIAPIDDSFAHLTNPDSYAEVEGRAFIFSDHLILNDMPAELLQETSLVEQPCEDDIMNAIGIVWFFEAASLYASNSQKSLDLLFEASDALAFSMSADSFDLAIDWSKEDSRERKTAKAKLMNQQRHSKKYRAEAMVLSEWEKNVGQFNSGELAGKHFANWLESKGFKYEPRTVTGWIRAHAKAKGIRFR